MVDVTVPWEDEGTNPCNHPRKDITNLARFVKNAAQFQEYVTMFLKKSSRFEWDVFFSAGCSKKYVSLQSLKALIRELGAND